MLSYRSTMKDTKKMKKEKPRPYQVNSPIYPKLVRLS
jgi:hypothetical protein